jgi:hypothetical protein
MGDISSPPPFFLHYQLADLTFLFTFWKLKFQISIIDGVVKRLFVSDDGQ